MARLHLRDATFAWDRPLVMGIVNANPDSFSDPGVRTRDAEVAAFLAERIAAAVAEGVDRETVVVDPGVDFTKTPAQTVELLRDLGPVVALGRPVLLALSRKDFVGALTLRPPKGRDAGTLG